MKIKVAPSILSADFSCLSEEIKRVERAGADLIHVDVMDGHFVPNITIGPVVVKYLRKVTKIPLDVHLMISEPQKYLEAFVKAGSDMITVHIETVSPAACRRMAARLRRRGVKFGVSLNPGTPFSKVKRYLACADFVLVMSVNPGFGGQAFMPVAIPKIKQIRSAFKGDIAVDGGINEKSAGKVIEAGANVLAAGSYIFGSRNAKQAIERIRNARQ